jgi:hypothetical protein
MSSLDVVIAPWTRRGRRDVLSTPNPEWLVFR